ncbi:DivIVA domain-containing protein [Microbacterium sp. YY-01]|uniref:DivIVA domain-containing protein n=1 Tax=Microbacterium sp. YY-01 TaxID=3421634 RepID=UPI003D16EC05
MALTPDDVVTKQFQHVRFKDGFDPDEVDDFLDEIVVEWRKVIEENTELKARLAAFESGEQRHAAPAATPTPAPQPLTPTAPVLQNAGLQNAGQQNAGPAATAGILELAQRLHDEHVAEGQAQRDQIVAEARNQATKIVAEAENKYREDTARLERERTQLEGRISELRDFERSYRGQLRSYIETQLRDLDSQGAVTPETPVSAIGL